MAHSDFGLRMAGIAHLNFCPFLKLSKMTEFARKPFFVFFFFKRHKQEQQECKGPNSINILDIGKLTEKQKLIWQTQEG